MKEMLSREPSPWHLKRTVPMTPQLYVFFIAEDYFLILDKSREAAYNHAHASDANEARCKSVGEEMQAMKHTCLRRSSKGYLKVLSVPPYRMCR